MKNENKDRENLCKTNSKTVFVSSKSGGKIAKIEWPKTESWIPIDYPAIGLARPKKYHGCEIVNIHQKSLNRNILRASFEW